MNDLLALARAYEKEASRLIGAEERPMFHLTPLTGWMNDPNGFSFYKGKYHLFYQYYPFDTIWNDMHWGHAVSTDLLRWTYLPAALAPDRPFDCDGCYSGSAEELPDGRHLLMYTGVCLEDGDKKKEVQTQCLAVGNGLDYEKLPANPVLDERDLPAGCDRYNFRDPKIRKTEDGYRCVAGTCDENGLGRIVQFASPDGFKWRFESVLVENDGSRGLMWECPDFFPLDGKDVLLVSPQDMLPEGFEYHNGNGTMAVIGRYDPERKRFLPETDQAVDYGIDFYAPTTMLAPDGRRIMIGWMQNWDTTKLSGSGRKDLKWFGQMTLPRELSIRNGRLYQQPVRELEQLRGTPVVHCDVPVDGEVRLPGVEGRTVDMELVVRPDPGAPLYHKFAVRFMQDERFHSGLSYRPHESVLRIDRKFSGSRRAYIHQRRCLVPFRNGEIRMRLILDRFSVEVFVNDGEQTMTATILTDPAARGISFFADGRARIDVTKYELCAEGSHENI